MPQCSKCGAEAADESAFCPDCGNKTSSVAFEPGNAGGPRRSAVLTLLAILNFVGAGALALFGIVGLVLSAAEGSGAAVAGILLLLLAGLQIVAGFGLWRLRGYGRAIQIAFAAVGLLLVPVGTVIGAVILHYLTRPHVRILFARRSFDELSVDDTLVLARSSDSGTFVALAIAASLAAVSVPFILIVAAVAVPNLLNAIDRGRLKRTVSDIRSIGNAMEAYAIDQGSYPVARDMAELEVVLEPDYLRITPTLDGWQRSIDTRSDGKSYIVRSAGKDGVFEVHHAGGPRDGFDADIVYEDGRFIQWPDKIGP